MTDGARTLSPNARCCAAKRVRGQAARITRTKYLLKKFIVALNFCQGSFRSPRAAVSPYTGDLFADLKN